MYHLSFFLSDDWYKKGGVLLMGYEMYRLLTSRRVKTNYKAKKSKTKNKDPGVIDLVQEEKDQDLLIGKSHDPGDWPCTGWPGQDEKDQVIIGKSHDLGVIDLIQGEKDQDLIVSHII